MKTRKTLRKVVKKEGKHSLVSKTIVKFKNSKEFDYLIDTKKA